MAPDWNKLGAQYADSASVLIVDVDCTADGEKTCQKMGVQAGVPHHQVLHGRRQEGQGLPGRPRLRRHEGRALPDCARCVMGSCIAQEARVQSVLDDVAGNVCSLPHRILYCSRGEGSKCVG